MNQLYKSQKQSLSDLPVLADNRTANVSLVLITDIESNKTLGPLRVRVEKRKWVSLLNGGDMNYSDTAYVDPQPPFVENKKLRDFLPRINEKNPKYKVVGW